MISLKEIVPALNVLRTTCATREENLTTHFSARLEHFTFYLEPGLHIRCNLEQSSTSAGADNGFLDRLRFAWISPGPWGQSTIRHPVPQKTGSGESDCAFLHRVFNQLNNSRQFLVVSLNTFVTTLVAHCFESNGRVPCQCNDIECGIQRLNGVQILAKTVPVPWKAIHDRVSGNILNGLH